MACRSSASSAPARTFAVPPYGAKTSPRFSSCAIPFAASAAVSARWSVTPSPAYLCHPASNPGAGIALLTHPSVGSISPGIPTPPILCYPRTPEKNHTPVGNLRSESKLKSKMDIPNSFLVEAVILNGVKDGRPLYFVFVLSVSGNAHHFDSSLLYSAIHPAWIAQSDRQATTIQSATPCTSGRAPTSFSVSR
jgi:hypothetical protein